MKYIHIFGITIDTKSFKAVLSHPRLNVIEIYCLRSENFNEILPPTGMKGIYFLHDNVPAHKGATEIVCLSFFLQEKRVTVLSDFFMGLKKVKYLLFC
jgi:hypothetical protein